MKRFERRVSIAKSSKIVMKINKGTMTEVSMMEKPRWPTKLKPSAPPRRHMDFADQEREKFSDLSDEDVKLARRIWLEHVEPFKENFVDLVFDHFFQSHNPEMVDLCMRLVSTGLPKLSLPDPDKPGSNSHLLALARIMARMRSILDEMHRPEKLTKLMTALGLAYVRAGFQVDNVGFVLKIYVDAVMSIIKMTMDDQMHPSEENALKKCFDLAFCIMEEACYSYYDLFVAIPFVEKTSMSRNGKKSIVCKR